MYPINRIKYEGVSRYQWFEYYCKIGTTRTLDEVAKHFDVKYKSILNAFKKWAWLTRASDYDLYQQKLNDAKRYEDIDKLKEQVESKILEFTANLTAMFDKLNTALGELSQSDNIVENFEECAKIMQTAMKTFTEFKKNIAFDFDNTVCNITKRNEEVEREIGLTMQSIMDDKELMEMYIGFMQLKEAKTKEKKTKEIAA